VISSQVLVVDDDPTVAEVVARYLEREGFSVVTCGDGAVGLQKVLASPPALVVLDLMLPGLDGLEVCRRLRESSDVPIIMLTAKGEAGDRITGMERGADDYLAKPFSPRELVVRVKAVLARTRGGTPGGREVADGPLMAGPIALDERARTVTLENRPVSLTVREFDLLAFLLHHPGEVFRREDLLRRVWGYTFGDTSTVTVHVRRLREKIERDPSVPVHVVTVWGVGYRFDA
jgi:DNA-binding response OmpR family regulator